MKNPFSLKRLLIVRKQLDILYPSYPSYPIKNSLQELSILVIGFYCLVHFVFKTF